MAETALTVGKQAPAFTLPDQDGAKVALKDQRGQWVVLYFYPKDDTPGCTTQACEFTAAEDEFTQLGATVFGVSPDGPESHRNFIAKHKLAVQLLCDADHKVMTRYGAWGEKQNYGRTYEGVIRSTVLIDPKGKVAAHWRKVRAAGHADKVRQKLADLGAAPATS
jgi:peroxiredoxin Q/BCP